MTQKIFCLYPLSLLIFKCDSHTESVKQVSYNNAQAGHSALKSSAKSLLRGVPTLSLCLFLINMQLINLFILQRVVL